ncbi:MAG: hypothetical protein JNN25_14365 [Candidatus Kapabacteria bacterium]|nr:hypothetical protein [Candidatus Kapabacteria bacterium]
MNTSVLRAQKRDAVKQTPSALALTKQDSSAMRATHITIARTAIGRRVIVNASFSPNACNNPQMVPLLTCRIGNGQEERIPIDERFAYKNPRFGGNSWSNHFRFGYVTAQAKRIIVRALWIRGADTLTLLSDTALPTFSILRPNHSYGNWISQSHDKQFAIITEATVRDAANVNATFTLTQLAPPYSVHVPIDAVSRTKEERPEIIYATTGNMQMTGTAPYLDYAASSLALYAGNTPDTVSQWRLSPQTLRCLAIRPNTDQSAFDAEFEASGISLPSPNRELYSLKGVLVFQYGLYVRNPLNGMTDTLPVRRKFAKVQVAFVHDVSKEQHSPISEDTLKQWLRRYIRTVSLPPKLAVLLQAKHLNMQILHKQYGVLEMFRRLNVELPTTSKLNLRQQDELALREDCDMWSKIEWNARFGLPKPTRLIAESSSPEACERLWEYHSRLTAPFNSHCIAFVDESAESNTTTARLLALVPFGIGDGGYWSTLLEKASTSDLVQCALSRHNMFLKNIWTSADLQTISTKTDKKEITSWGGTASIDGTKTKNMSEYLDTLLHNLRYSTSVRSERAAEQAYQQFLAWSDTARGIENAPFRLMETDTAAMIRLREVYITRPGMVNQVKTEQQCSNTREIKKFAAAGKPIPPYLTDDDEAEDECRSVAWYYKTFYEARNIGRVLVAFHTAGEQKGLPAFALCIGALPLDSTALQRPLPEQVRKPMMSAFLSVDDLQSLECEQIEGECPVRGSMTTEYRTLYDYCTIMTRRGRFLDRTSEIVIKTQPK